MGHYHAQVTGSDFRQGRHRLGPQGGLYGAYFRLPQQGQETCRPDRRAHEYNSALMYLVPRYVYVGTYVPGLHPPKKKNRRHIDEIAPKKQNKNNLNTELTEMGVFSAVAGNQLPNQLQKGVLQALFHLRCPSQSHQRSARGRARPTTVTSISCRSF